LASRYTDERSRCDVIAACGAFAYDSRTGNSAGKGESSEMSDAIGTFMPKQRTGFAGVGVRWLPQWHAGAASLAGARPCLCIDPGGGPGI
jgi:hypothetical protein